MALGVPKDATAQQIKTTYRKLALKFHPDKVTDESLKASAADNFHRIQQAYEILGDEDKKSRYDKMVRLAELRKDVMEKQAQNARPDVRTATAAFEIPTQTPGRSTFTARGPERTTSDDRRPPTYDYDDYFGAASTRKDAEYERQSRKYATKGESEKTKAYTREKENVKTARSASSKTTTKERRKVRGMRDVVEDETESDDEYMRSKRREEDRERDAYSTRRPRDSSSQYDYHADSRRAHQAEDDVRDYIRKSHQKSSDDVRPSMPRMSTDREPYLERHRPEKRPEMGARRSSARPVSSGQERRRDREGRKYSAPEVDVSELKSSRRPATLEKLHSSPANIHIPSEPRRRETYDTKREDNDFVAPSLPRSQTMPVGGAGTSRSRKESTPLVSSKLRYTDNYGRPPSPPTTSPEYSSPEEYDYPTSKHTTSNGRPTILREPESFGRSSSRRSPPPAAEPIDKKARSRHASQAPPPIRTDAGKFPYTSSPPMDSAVDMSNVRPIRPSPIARHASEQVQGLYGEIPTTSSPKDTIPMTPGGSRRVTTQYQYPELSSRDRERDRDYITSRLDRDPRDRDIDRRDRDRERERERDRDREPVKYKYATIADDDFVKYPKREDVKMASGTRGSARRGGGGERRPEMPSRVSYAY